jgi:hypothetical protein
MIASSLDSRMTAARITTAQAHAQASALSPTMLRTLLLSGCALAAAIALGYGVPEAAIRVDRELAYLLRGMALIKAGLVVAAVGVLWWRLAHAIDRGAAAGYLAGAFLMSAASGLIWQLTLIGLGAVAFHVGGFMVLLVAYFDRDAMLLTNRNSRARP